MTTADISRKTLGMLLAIALCAWCVSCERAASGPDVNFDEKGLPDNTSWPSFRGGPSADGVAQSILPDQLELLWTRQLQVPVQSTAAIVDGVVFLGTRTSVVALDLATSKLKWTHKTDAPVFASPCVKDGIVFVGDLGGTFHALDAGTGELLWSAPTDGQIVSSANVSDDAVIVGSDDYSLYFFVREDGIPLSKIETGSYIRGGACVFADEAVVVGCDGILRLIGVHSGKETASIELNTNVGCTPAWHSGRVYLTTFDDHVICVDVAERRAVWNWEPPDAERSTGTSDPITSSPAVTDDVVVVGTTTGKVRGLKTSTGEELWKFETRAEVESSPVISGDRVYFGSSDGNVYGLTVADGKEVWRFTAGGSVAASPAVARRRLVIANDKGAVYCFGPKSR